jgi:hypothetical protein
MFEFNFHLFAEVITMMDLIHRMALGAGGFKPTEKYSDEGQEFQRRLLLLGIHLGDCGLPVSAASMCHVAETIELGQSLKDISVEIDAFNKIFELEIRNKAFFAMPSGLLAYNKTAEELFGPDVIAMFSGSGSDATADIEEAGKCLAFGRSTAAVFHLMRVMEVGLKALSKNLGIPYAPSWESYLKQMQERIETKHKLKSVSWKRDEPFFRDALGDLQAVKVAGRNPTMHVVRRYTPEESQGVYLTVRTFMKRIAAGPPRRGVKKQRGR